MRERMLCSNAGWMDEVRELMSRESRKTARPLTLSATGELRGVLSGELQPGRGSRGAIQQATRRYAKRQLTWFRREREVHWLAGFGDQPEATATGAAGRQG